MSVTSCDTEFYRRTVAKWIRADALPQRCASAAKTTSPLHFEDYLSIRFPAHRLAAAGFASGIEAVNLRRHKSRRGEP